MGSKEEYFPEPGKNGITVLIVDDDDLNIDILAIALRREDYALYTAETPERALELASVAKNLAVVVSDYDMPCMNGSELLVKIQESHPCATRVLMSGNIERVEKGSYAHRYISKPIEVDILKDEIKVGIEEYRRRVESKCPTGF